MIGDVGMDNVKVHLDTYHMNIEENSMAQAVLTAGDKLGCAPSAASLGVPWVHARLPWPFSEPEAEEAASWQHHHWPAGRDLLKARQRHWYGFVRGTGTSTSASRIGVTWARAAWSLAGCSGAWPPWAMPGHSPLRASRALSSAPRCLTRSASGATCARAFSHFSFSPLC